MRHHATVLHTKAATFLIALGLATGWWSCQGGNAVAGDSSLKLESPKTDGSVSVESALSSRRSRRSFSGPASLEQLSQLLWAAQGVTDRENAHRATPSAGALYPLEVYLLANDVERLEPGVYHYDPASHSLNLHATGNRKAKLAAAALGQPAVATAPAVVVLTAVYGRTRVKYGGRAERYVHMEVGSAAENVYLQAEALGLATVLIGAFQDAEVKRALDLPRNHAPLALLPVGMR